MKLRLSSKGKWAAGLMVLALAGTGGYALLPREDSILKEIRRYQSESGVAARSLAAQMETISRGQGLEEADEQGYTPLMNAVRTGSVAAVDYLLIKGARLHTLSPGGESVRTLAEDDVIRELLRVCELAESPPSDQERESMKQNLRNAGIPPDDLNQALFETVSSWRDDAPELTAQVLALGGNANALDNEGRHILLARHRNAATIVLLLRQGADPNARINKRGGSEALLSSVNSLTRNTRNFLVAGASIKDPDILARAAGAGNAEIVRRLLALGADPNGISSDGFSILEHAVQGRERYSGENIKTDIPSCVEMLLKAGARTEVSGKGGRMRSPISPGGMSILPACIRLLVDAGANVNTLNSRGANYAHIAAYKEATPENLQLLRDIISAGVDVTHKDDKGETLLFYALPSLCAIDIMAEDEDAREEAEELLEDYLKVISRTKPDPADRDRNGNTALHLAVIRRGPADAEIVRYLLEMGVDPGVRNQFGRTALEALLLAPHGPASAAAARLLVDKSPALTTKKSRLILAALLGNDAELPGLLADKWDQDTLHTAMMSTHSAAITDALLEAGAPFYYETGRHLAQHGAADIVPVLQKHNQLQRLAPHWASVRDLPLAQAMLKAGLKAPTIADISSGELLQGLIDNGLFDINGTELNMKSWHNPELPLTYAVRQGDVDRVQILLDSGAAVNGFTDAPLALAEKAEIAQMLLEKGADTNWRSARGETLLSLHKQKLKETAERHLRHPGKELLEQFREHFHIAGMLEKAGAPETHPRLAEIKKALQSPDCTEACETVEFDTDGWRGTVRISREAMVLARSSGNTDTANILSFTPDSISFKWDRWGYGNVVRIADGRYRQDANPARYTAMMPDPRRHPHYFVHFQNEHNARETLYLHPDLQYAVRSGNQTGARVVQLHRGYSTPSIKLRMNDGKELQLMETDGVMAVLNADSAKKLLKAYRPAIPYQEVDAVGPSWQDKLRISREQMAAARRTGPDAANVLEISDNRLVLKWDRWGTEGFTRRADGKFYSDALPTPEEDRIRQLLHENSKSIRIRQFTFVHPYWTETIRISFKHRIAVQAGGRKSSAKVTSFNKHSVTLKWDDFGTETFVRGADGRFYLQKQP